MCFRGAVGPSLWLPALLCYRSSLLQCREEHDEQLCVFQERRQPPASSHRREGADQQLPGTQVGGRSELWSWTRDPSVKGLCRVLLVRVVTAHGLVCHPAIHRTVTLSCNNLIFLTPANATCFVFHPIAVYSRLVLNCLSLMEVSCSCSVSLCCLFVFVCFPLTTACSLHDVTPSPSPLVPAPHDL